MNVEYCWSKALEFTRRAEETTDDEVRTFFYRLRESWIRAANHQELLGEAGDMLMSQRLQDANSNAQRHDQGSRGAKAGLRIARLSLD